MVYLIVTSISAPNKVLRSLAEGAGRNNIPFILIGDVPSPEDFALEGTEFLNITSQKETGFTFAAICPERHYCRKNIGYLLAIRGGAEVIIETDDDNFPRSEFWNTRQAVHEVRTIAEAGWYNVYSEFSSEHIWPRGFPLELLSRKAEGKEQVQGVYCPVQQGMADDNPDVDAVYRMTSRLPVQFDKGRVALGNKTWCPFNSQNTTFFKEAFPLLYLPATCSFRMTDIWRSFVAQRICWENEWHILFHEATVWQERNEHNLLRDFEQEIPGYLNNAKLCEALEALPLRKGKEYIPSNMILCYEKMRDMGLVRNEELTLLDAWLKDLASM